MSFALPPAESTGLLPVFAPREVILLPHANLPLRLVEPQHVAMLEYALLHNRLVGVIQPKTDDMALLYNVGCAGRITSFSEVGDGRYLVNLLGVARFVVHSESWDLQGFKKVEPDWSPYPDDRTEPVPIAGNLDRLIEVLRLYFNMFDVSADWGIVQSMPYEDLVTTLSMICPFSSREKQALLEAHDLEARAETLLALLEMACLRHDEGLTAQH